MKKTKDAVDISGFGEVVKGLANLSGKTFKEVLKTEVGMVLNGAARKTKVADIKGRMSKGKLRGGIVPYNLPQGFNLLGADGAKLITKRNGRFYHVGEPKMVGRQPNTVGMKTPPGVKKRFPKRGGKIYAHPYPRQQWLKEHMFGEVFPKALATTKRKITYRGITAGQFPIMAEKANIVFPIRGLGKNKMRAMLSPAVRKIVAPRSSGTNITQKFEAAIKVESKGIKMSATRGANRKLLEATRARINLFKNQAIKKEFYKDMKNWMPSRYPLIFSK